VDKENTTIVVARASSRTPGPHQQIKAAIEKSTSDYDKEKLQERLASWPRLSRNQRRCGTRPK